MVVVRTDIWPGMTIGTCVGKHRVAHGAVKDRVASEVAGGIGSRVDATLGDQAGISRANARLADRHPHRIVSPMNVFPSVVAVRIETIRLELVPAAERALIREVCAPSTGRRIVRMVANRLVRRHSLFLNVAVWPLHPTAIRHVAAQI